MMLTHAYWQHSFGGDPSAVGKVFRINGRSATVIGVAEPAPSFPTENDVFVNMVTSPHHLDATMVTGRTHRMTEVFARLAPGATVEQARAEITALTARLRREHPDAYDPGAGFQVTVAQLRTRSRRRPRHPPHRDSRAGAAHRLRQRRQPGRHSWGTPGARAGDPLGSGRRPGTTPPVAADGNRDPRRTWHRPWAGPRLSRPRPAGRIRRADSRRGRRRSGWMVACWRSRSRRPPRWRRCSPSCLRCGTEESALRHPRRLPSDRREPADPARAHRGDGGGYGRGAYRRGAQTRTLLRLYAVDPGVRMENTLTHEVPLEGDRTGPRVGAAGGDTAAARGAAGRDRGRRRVERSPPRLRRAARAQGGGPGAGPGEAEAGGGVPDGDRNTSARPASRCSRAVSSPPPTAPRQGRSCS